METKWNGTIERRQGSGRPSIFTAEEDNMLLNRLCNSPFMTAVEGGGQANTTERSGRFSANIWAWILVDRPGLMFSLEDRLNSDVYVRILEDVMMPLVSRIFPNFNFIFQQDNCSMHSAHRVVEW
jgi:hypothetical protein